MIEVRQHLEGDERFIKIFSDLQAALKSLARNKVKLHVAGQTMREFNIMGAFTDRLQLDWIRANSNHKGNERADELARFSVFINNVSFDTQPPISLFKKEICTCIHKEWTEEWQKTQTSRMTKIINPNPARSNQLLNITREKSTMLIEAITG